ncbi:hypothetical protein [Phyllobacterium zundukense]|uniref:Uncharacterized protein n=1 Tax=Phyllobacterium zundukense TaxID=1867719 RepID=A0ACD4D534_9HYPH|nr:hypothetical protein [Phyllobacterium zundukense]UXN60898.1 hypothetical protein N8E88_31340 [Phyllobacterium zundukense]
MADYVFSRLTYYGHCWPAAKVVDRQTVLYSSGPNDEPDGEEQVWKFELSGNGRPFTEKRPNGWWRSFASMSLDDREAVTDWMQRKGDPFKFMTPNSTLTTARWSGVKKTLQAAAALFGERDTDGVARIEADAAACTAALTDLLEITKLLIRFSPHVVPGEGRLATQPFAPSLDAFLHGSAAHMIDARLPMNTCLHCNDWFPVYRAGTKYCSTTCRAAASLAKGVA